MGLLLIFGLLTIASILGALLAKMVEKHRQKKLGMGEIQFYVGIPIGIVILIWIFLMETMK